MEMVTLQKINENVLSLKKELEDIKEILEEGTLDLRDGVKLQIKESRKRPLKEFKTQKEIEKKFS
ncbi:MAG: hypothetical protein AABW45_00850 [Nanoarchaeota archaeon]